MRKHSLRILVALILLSLAYSSIWNCLSTSQKSENSLGYQLSSSSEFTSESLPKRDLEEENT
ncbi:MAG: hypothetical protein ACFFBD_26290, partial [Candidatus Hodarchaeota archaeon]